MLPEFKPYFFAPKIQIGATVIISPSSKKKWRGQVSGLFAQPVEATPSGRHKSAHPSVARWYSFKPKISIWVYCTNKSLAALAHPHFPGFGTNTKSSVKKGRR
jgi:hypothetical protein